MEKPKQRMIIAGLTIVMAGAVAIWVVPKLKSWAAERGQKTPQGVGSAAPSPPFRDSQPVVASASGLRSPAVPGLAADGLRIALRFALSHQNTHEIAALLRNEGGNSDGLRQMEELLVDQTLPVKARRHGAQELMKLGDRGAAQAVAGAAIQNFAAGNPEAGGAILSVLDTQVTIEASIGLVDVLLGLGESMQMPDVFLTEVQASLRKALRGAPDGKKLGTVLADRYSELKDAGQVLQANELIEGVAHPGMIVELAAQAHARNDAHEVTGLLDRLIAMDDPGIVGALAQLAAEHPLLLNEAAEVILNWSLEHSRDAQPGLFMGYLSNCEAPLESRVTAAFGLAGSNNQAEARRALEKAISFESDATIRQLFQSALANLNNDTSAPPESGPSKE